MPGEGTWIRELGGKIGKNEQKKQQLYLTVKTEENLTTHFTTTDDSFAEI